MLLAFSTKVFFLRKSFASRGMTHVIEAWSFLSIFFGEAIMAMKMFGAVLAPVALAALAAGCSVLKQEVVNPPDQAAIPGPPPVVAQVFPSPPAPGTNPQLFGKPPYSFSLDESLAQGESAVIAGPKKAVLPKSVLEKAVAAAPVVAASAVASSTPAWPPSALSAADEVARPAHVHRVPSVGPRDFLSSFGYEGNSLVYSPWFGGKSISATPALASFQTRSMCQRS